MCNNKPLSLNQIDGIAVYPWEVTLLYESDLLRIMYLLLLLSSSLQDGDLTRLSKDIAPVYNPNESFSL